MNNLTFEQKVLMLAATKSGKDKQDLLNKFTFGDIQFTSRYFSDAVSLEKYMEVNRERFRPVAEEAARLRANMKNRGWTDKKYQKYIGQIPEALEFERPEFSKNLPQKIRDRNIRMFLQKYPAFKVDK